MSDGDPELRWGGVEQRLEFIEFRLFWEGGINRADITGFFGVSVPQASKDLTQYQELAPENVRYDRSQKRYFATDSFKLRFLKPDADRYLAQLTFAVDPILHGERTGLASLPSVDTMPVPHRRVDVLVLRTILAPVRDATSVGVLYQSMNELRPAPIWRRITPHAFGSTPRKYRSSRPRSRILYRERAVSPASCRNSGSLAGLSLILERLSSETNGAWR